MKKPLKRKWYKLFFLDYRFFIRRNPLFEVCPNCGKMASLERLKESSRIYRLPRFFGFRKYHCTACKWDGYIYLFQKTKNSLKKVIINYIIAILFLFILYYILLFFLDDILHLIYS